MITEKTYLLSSFPNSFCDIRILHNDILASSIGAKLDRVDGSSTSVTAFFTSSLDASEESVLDSVKAAYVGDPNAAYKLLIQNAIEFFSEELIKFAAENVSLGITQAGKTKDVADYLDDILRYGQSGSLYEVRNTIINLQTAGFPQDLDPYVNDARMLVFLNEVETYLGLPLTSW